MHLVPVQDAADLSVVTRLSRRAGHSIVHRPAIDPRSYDQLKELLRQSQLRELLFATGAVLVEGPTEVDCLDVWLTHADSVDPELPTPETAHVVFVSVGGDERFPKFTDLMTQLGIPYAIVADGPAFRVGGALSKLAAQPPDSADPSHETFEEATKRWASMHVHTLATQFGTGEDKGKGEIEAFFEGIDPKAWESLNSTGGRKDKALLGYRFASAVPVPATVIDLWRRLLADLAQQ